jgi:hypothetical protein
VVRSAADRDHGAGETVTTVTDVYELNLAMSGKLKLRASARLAEGSADTIFEACVLLHEAARVERRAIDSLPGCPASTRLVSSIEECWCLVEGRDPERAGRAWGNVLQNLGRVDTATGAAMLVRLRPRFEASERAFKRVLAGSKNLMALRGGGSLIPATKEGRLAIHREVQQILEAFPGAISFWWASYRLLEAMGDKKGAFASLGKARLLDPENRRFEALRLLLAAQWLPEKAADEYLDGVRSSLENAGAAVCLMYAHAEIELAKKAAAPKVRWSRALDAANAGLTQAPAESLRKNLKATQLLLTALLAGQEPTLDILYLAGLGELAATAQSTKNVAALVTQLASRNVAANESVDQVA